MDNKLILDTRSEEMVYTSLSNILDISRNELEKSIYSVYKKYKEDNNINLIFEL